MDLLQLFGKQGAAGKMLAGSVLRRYESPIFRKYLPRGDDSYRKNDAVADRGAVIENWWQHVFSGIPKKAILKFVKDNKIDLIVIGSQGLGGIKKIKTLGSVSRTIS